MKHCVVWEVLLGKNAAAKGACGTDFADPDRVDTLTTRLSSETLRMATTAAMKLKGHAKENKPY